MRMLLRASTFRYYEHDAETEIAAAPDTPGRERWVWELRLVAAGTPEALTLHLSDGSTAVLALRGDPDLVGWSLRQEPLGTGIELAREPGELVVLVAFGGPVLVDGVHHLEELDALVVEGEERPTTVAPASNGAGVGSGTADAGAAPGLAVARLVSRSGKHLRWVP